MRAKFQKHGAPYLVLISSNDLCTLGGTQVETGDVAECFGKEGGDDKYPAARCDDRGKLDIELLPIVIEPASRNGGVDTVEGDDSALSEETVEQETDDSTHGVLSEQIEGIVNTNPVLDCGDRRMSSQLDGRLREARRTLGAEIAHGSGDDTKDDTGPDWNVSRRRCGCDETSDGARAKTNHGELLLETVIELLHAYKYVLEP